MNKPPDIPAFGATVKKARKESLTDALTGAVATFMKAFGNPDVRGSSREVSCEPTPSVTGVSPGKTVDLRMKNLKQLQ